MTYALIHPSLFISLTSSNNATEINQAIYTLIEWSHAHTTKMVECRATSVMQTNPYYPTLELLDSIYKQFGDGTWTPYQVFSACIPLLSVSEADNLLCKSARSIASHDVKITPRLFSENKIDAVHIEANDSAMLALEKKNKSDRFDWIIAAVCPSRGNGTMSLKVDGQLMILQENGGILTAIHEDLDCYLSPPKSKTKSKNKDDEAIDIVRKAVQGRRALFIGGIGWERTVEEIKSVLGFNEVKFLEHYRKSGQNISVAKSNLKSGKFNYFIHFVGFGSHSPSNLKKICSEDTIYIPVNGNPSVLSVVAAIRYNLHLV